MYLDDHQFEPTVRTGPCRSERRVTIAPGSSLYPMIYAGKKNTREMQITTKQSTTSDTIVLGRQVTGFPFGSLTCLQSQCNGCGMAFVSRIGCGSMFEHTKLHRFCISRCTLQNTKRTVSFLTSRAKIKSLHWNVKCTKNITTLLHIVLIDDQKLLKYQVICATTNAHVRGYQFCWSHFFFSF